MKEVDLLKIREKEFKQYMANKTGNTEEKQENWYYPQEFDECCSKCEYAKDDWNCIIGESFRCAHCGVVDWNGWCKRFTGMKRRE